MPMFLSAQHHPVCYPSYPQNALAFFRAALEKANPIPHPSSLRGIITPHIDFRVSLASYGQAFRPLLDQPPAETYLILGVGHRSPLEWNLDRRDYLTPLGQAENATDLVDSLITGIGDFSYPAAHRGEHSIEFPLVWLQALAQIQGRGPIRFLPLLCGGLHEFVDGLTDWEELTDFHNLATALGKLLRDAGTKIGVIVSIDGCHQGPRFQHPYPVTPEIQQDTAAWEEKLWQEVKTGTARSFLDWVRKEKNQRYFDGVGALALLRAAVENITIHRTDYEQWYEAGDQSMVTFSSGHLT